MWNGVKNGYQQNQLKGRENIGKYTLLLMFEYNKK